MVTVHCGNYLLLVHAFPYDMQRRQGRSHSVRNNVCLHENDIRKVQLLGWFDQSVDFRL